MGKFISCDWGTSSFRLRLVEMTGVAVIAEENSADGVARVFDLWKQTGRPENSRFSFYVERIRTGIGSIEKKSGYSLEGIPVVISGMATSTLGMIDLPYKELPFAVDGSDAVTRLLRLSDDFKHDMLFISGVKSDHDAMRGEETLLVGCVHDGEKERLFIFPGTHSKHVAVKNGKGVDLETFMTGEFFALLSQKSILSATVESNEDMDNEKNKNSFEAGVKESVRSNLLNSSFRVRTNDLFHELTQRENYHFLSGLLIGTEMKEVPGNISDITLVSDPHLRSRYEMAFNVVRKKDQVLTFQEADEAMVAGQLRILNRLLK